MLTPRQFELKVLKFIDDEGLIKSADTLLVAVSGGSDSVCLLMLLAKWAKVRNWKLKVAYFDHGLRTAAKKEARFVERLAQNLNLSFVKGQADCKRLKLKSSFSTEEVARDTRYIFLYKEARRMYSRFRGSDDRVHGSDGQAKIALAHHIDDQVETFFLQLLRGSGRGGLSGMKPQTGNVIRPLLGVTKQEILAYLKNQKINFRVDETNESLSFLRNKVRLKLLPYIKKVFKDFNVLKTIPKIMNTFGDEDEFLEVLSNGWMSKHLISKEAGYELDVASFKRLPTSIQRRTIKNVLDRFSSRKNYSKVHIEENRRLFYNPVSHKKLMLPEGIRVEKLKKAVFFNQII